jgi:DNA mismatch endonuclease, patch repair protein
MLVRQHANKSLLKIEGHQLRSSIMSRVRSSGNKSTELRVIKLFKKLKIIGWRRKNKLVGNPDFIFKESKIAFFVDGCFWHGHFSHKVMPRANRQYWVTKILRNKRRDRKVNKTLMNLGWKVMRIWECQLKNKNNIIYKFARHCNHLKA